MQKTRYIGMKEEKLHQFFKLSASMYAAIYSYKDNQA